MSTSRVMAHLALGSNLGDRRAMIGGAMDAIAAAAGIDEVARSGVVETEPVGPAGQGRYLNAAMTIETTLGARALLELALGIERAMGRERVAGERWGARFIDIDLLLYGDAVIGEPGLRVPHPRMHERAFVLVPLAEIAPDAVHPVLGRRVSSLLASLGAGA